MTIASRAWCTLVALAFVAGGCSKLNLGGGNTVPTASPSATPTISPEPCGTPDSTNPNLVVVGMASAFAATSAGAYGNIGGYAVIDPTGASPAPAQAVVVSQQVSGAAITSNNTVQFVNLEEPGSIVHSAYGFTGDAFPAAPYSFPSPAPSPTATVIGNTSWFTGRIASLSSGLCYSQEFKLKAGTYYFGDYDYYNITTFRDVIVVATPGAQSTLKHKQFIYRSAAQLRP